MPDDAIPPAPKVKVKRKFAARNFKVVEVVTEHEGEMSTPKGFFGNVVKFRGKLFEWFAYGTKIKEEPDFDWILNYSEIMLDKYPHYICDEEVKDDWVRANCDCGGKSVGTTHSGWCDSLKDGWEIR